MHFILYAVQVCLNIEKRVHGRVALPVRLDYKEKEKHSPGIKRERTNKINDPRILPRYSKRIVFGTQKSKYGVKRFSRRKFLYT